LAAVFLVVVSTTQAQTLRIVQVINQGGDGFPANVQFFCDQDYNRIRCVEHIAKLKQELARYPIEGLGAWSFVLVPSDRWKRLVGEGNGNPDSPAFSVIADRITIFEEALLVTMPLRDVELLPKFGVLGDALLRLAVTHELGHAMCHEFDERRADDYGRALREGGRPKCNRGAPTLASSKISQPARR
jgi:hypothetical protein